MRIDIHNYEAFFLDYKEGNLDAAQVKELFAFLEEYPQLKAELDSFEPVVLEMEEAFMEKSKLRKKNVNEEILIAYVENTLGNVEKREVELLATENTSLAKELRLYKSTIFTVDENVKFPRKSRLKKRGVVIFLQSNPAFMRVAAAMLLLFGLFFLVSKLNNKEAIENNAVVLAAEDGKKNQQESVRKNELVTSQKHSVNLATLDKKNKNVAGKKEKNRLKHELKSSNHINDEVPVISNTPVVNTATALANNKNEKSENDSVAIATISPENKATYRSYFNYSAEEDDSESIGAKQDVTASAVTNKKTFFQKITNAAHKVNELGMKKVEGEEQSGTSSISIGGLVLSETVSN